MWQRKKEVRKVRSVDFGLVCGRVDEELDGHTLNQVAGAHQLISLERNTIYSINNETFPRQF